MTTLAIMVNAAASLPYAVSGYASPYPTVVSVTTHHQNVAGIDENGSSS